MALPAGRRQQGRPPGGILGALLAWPDSDIWLCRRDGANMVGRRAEFVAPCWRGPTVIYGFAGRAAPTWSAGKHAAALNFCEDFAPRDGGTRPCGERGANRAAEMPAEGRRRRGISVKILLPETVAQGLAGSGEQIAPLKRPPEADGGAEFL